MNSSEKTDSYLGLDDEVTSYKSIIDVPSLNAKLDDDSVSVVKFFTSKNFITNDQPLNEVTTKYIAWWLLIDNIYCNVYLNTNLNSINTNDIASQEIIIRDTTKILFYSLNTIDDISIKRSIIKSLPNIIKLSSELKTLGVIKADSKSAANIDFDKIQSEQFNNLEETAKQIFQNISPIVLRFSDLGDTKEELTMPRQNERERDENGRFVSDDDNRHHQSRFSNNNSNRQFNHNEDNRGWHGDARGHSEAARKGWENRSEDSHTQLERNDNQSRSSRDDDRGSGNRDRDEDGRFTSRGRSSRDDDDRGSGNRDRDEDGRLTSRGRSSRDDDDRGSGNRDRDEDGRFTSRGRSSRDDDDRGSGNRDRDEDGRFTSRGRSSRDDDDRGSGNRDRDEDGRFTSRGRSSRDDDEGQGWHGDSRGHAETARKGWENRRT